MAEFVKVNPEDAKFALCQLANHSKKNNQQSNHYEMPELRK